MVDSAGLDTGFRHWRVGLVIAPGVVMLILALLLVKPIAQDPNYHNFADQRVWLGIAHFGDVITNAAFIIVGASGLGYIYRARSARGAFAFDRERVVWAVFFTGILLTGFGSAWYHLQPDNARLVWDRLPMTFAFMSLFSAVVSERIDVRAGTVILGPLVIVGLVSVGWWAFTEHQGQGDLRPYGLVQFYPLVGVMLMLVLFPSRYTRGNDYWVALSCYAAAKLGELLDHHIFNINGVISGHSLKHLLAAASGWWMLRMVQRRRANV